MAREGSRTDGPFSPTPEDPAVLREIRSTVESVVRSFRFSTLDAYSDLAQEAITRILGSLAGGRFRGEASLSTYATAIARYTCLGYLRSERLTARIDLDSLPAQDRWAEPEGLLLRQEEHDRNVRAFLALPRDCQILLQLIFVERLSYREAAAHLGITESALKARVHRCRLAGRASIAREGETVARSGAGGEGGKPVKSHE